MLAGKFLLNEALGEEMFDRMIDHAVAILEEMPDDADMFSKNLEVNTFIVDCAAHGGLVREGDEDQEKSDFCDVIAQLVMRCCERLCERRVVSPLVTWAAQFSTAYLMRMKERVRELNREKHDWGEGSEVTRALMVKGDKCRTKRGREIRHDELPVSMRDAL